MCCIQYIQTQQQKVLHHIQSALPEFLAHRRMSCLPLLRVLVPMPQMSEYHVSILYHVSSQVTELWSSPNGPRWPKFFYGASKSSNKKTLPLWSSLKPWLKPWTPVARSWSAIAAAASSVCLTATWAELFFESCLVCRFYTWQNDVKR